MALVLQDRVSVNSTGSGTGSLVLGSAYPGFRTFASCIPDGSAVYYTIANQAVGFDTEFEVGIGTYTLSTNTLSRTTVLSSSNADALVNFTAGTNGLQIFITQPAERAVYQETNGDVLIPNGILTVIGSNATNPTFTATLGEFVSNVPTFSQLFAQNQSNSANASTDIVAYNNLGDGTSYFVDVGISSSTYNEAAYPIFQANDAYLYNAGNVAGTGAAGDISRLMIGTSTANSNVVIFGGSVNVNAVITTFVASTKDVNFANNISVTSNVAANNITLTNFAYSAGNINAAANTTVLTTKAYVDNAVATGFIVHDAAVYATAAPLPNSPTYNNGTSGVGATLTANANAALVIDGVTLVSPTNNGIRVLIKNEVSSQYNGIYVVTESGSGSAPWVLTRATDFDTYTAGNIATNAYVYVTSGDTNIGSSWIFSQIGTVVVGTTPLHFELFSQPAAYTGTAPINVSGQIISLTGIVPVANGGTNLSSFTTGDVIYANATNTLTRRAIGAANTVLVSNGTIPDWGTVALGSANAVSGTLGPTNGGTGQSTYTLGDIVYANGTNTLAKLPGNITTTQKFLSQTGTGSASAVPVWDTIPAGSITGLGTMASQNANNVAITGGSLNNVTIGATTANSGAFTTLAYSSTLTGGTGIVNLGSGQFYKDANGNIGVGVIPSAWRSTNPALQIGQAGGLFGYSSSVITGLASNTFINSAGDEKYIATGTATLYQQNSSGTHRWFTAASGTAGDTVTFTERFSIGPAGQWGIGGSYGTAGQVFVSAGPSSPPTWTTAVANAITTTNIAGGAAGSIPYQSAAGTTQMLATGSGVLVGGTTPAYSTTPTLTGTNFSAIPNSALSNSSTTINGTAIALGSSGTITAATPNAVTFNNGGSGAASGSTYTGASALTVSYNTVGAPSTGGAGATGTWGISISGSAASATTAGSATTATTATTATNQSGGTVNATTGAFSSTVSTGALTVSGAMTATGNITAFFSDERLKTKTGNIENALDKVCQIETMLYHANETAVALGYDASIQEVGVTAQSVQKVQPEIVVPAPIDNKYLTVRYEKLVPLLIEAIKELRAEVAEIRAELKAK